MPESKAFQSAPPEAKALWDTAWAANKTNGYCATYGALQALRTQTNLDAQQMQAVEQFLGVVGTRMLKAAQDGDMEAVKALKEGPGRRR